MRWDRFLQVPSGSASQNVLDLARDGVRPALSAALRRLGEDAGPACGRSAGSGPGPRLEVQVRRVPGGGEAAFLICFLERTDPLPRPGPAQPGIDPHVAALELELAALRVELDAVGRSSDASAEEQKVLNEEALSVSEEYQSTNEELLTSKEELQSLNEELTALNSQLGETLDRQRTTANDMQNVLYSTDVATLFLDRALNIRFFTPATRSLFKVIPGDVGRPLTDLVCLAADASLPADAEAVLRDRAPREREIEAGGAWFTRRVLPYRTDDNGVEGVVITFTDITGRKQAARALEAAKHEAELANAAKSRFLAAASHDLRQPLQTLTLLQGLLAKAVAGQPAERFVRRLDDTLAAMAAMLNTVLDINQIEAGIVRAEVVTFSMGGLLDRLRDEFGEQARAQGLGWRVVPCGLPVRSDPVLLEQILRNLVSNALKYTRRGGVLLGCRRRGEVLRIEVHDTGIGIPADKRDTIFEEYSQLDNAARDRGKGLGLGLSIVRRLVDLVDHTVRVRSRPGGGSVFTVEVAISREGGAAGAGRAGPGADGAAATGAMASGPAAEASRTGGILVVEDEPAVLDLLQVFLSGEGHRVAVATDGDAALDLVAHGGFRPDLLLSDYNLPGGLNGLQLATRLRDGRTAPLPAVILTGDISAEALGDIAGRDCVPLNKPVGLEALSSVLQQLLPPDTAPAERRPPAPAGQGVVFVIDDDAAIRQGLRELLETGDRRVEDHGSAEAFLRAYRPGGRACVLVDANLPGLGGLDLLRRLRGAGDQVPAVVITGFGDVQVAVEAMKAGASDFIEKPVNPADLVASLDRALDQASESGALSAWRASAARAVSGLTDRQREVMAMVIAGHPSKNIAADLGISQRTVENHRAAIMERTGSRSLPALARLALAADWTGAGESFGAGAPGR